LGADSRAGSGAAHDHPDGLRGSLAASQTARLPGLCPRSALPARARNLVAAPVKQISEIYHPCLGGYDAQAVPLKQRVFSRQNL